VVNFNTVLNHQQGGGFNPGGATCVDEVERKGGMGRGADNDGEWGRGRGTGEGDDDGI
jgi:hypothetical protein